MNVIHNSNSNKLDIRLKKEKVHFGVVSNNSFIYTT